MSGIRFGFWAAGLCGHILLLAVLFGRRRFASFPAFTTLIAAEVVRSIVFYFFIRRFGTGNGYLIAYVTAGLIDVLLQFAVVYEVSSHVFRPQGRWAPDTERGIMLLIAGSLAMASGLTWLAAPEHAGWLIDLQIKTTFFSALLASELCIGLIVLSVTAGLPWRTHVARIAHGLGAYSLADVAVEAGHTLYPAGDHGPFQQSLTLTRMFVYLVCLVYWIITLWRDAPAPREMPAEMREQLRALQARMAYDLYTLRNWRKP